MINLKQLLTIEGHGPDIYDDTWRLVYTLYKGALERYAYEATHKFSLPPLGDYVYIAMCILKSDTACSTNKLGAAHFLYWLREHHGLRKVTVVVKDDDPKYSWRVASILKYCAALESGEDVNVDNE